MAQQRSGPPAQLFYSYCHKDARYREAMEQALTVLRDEELLQQWSDQRILPGQKISAKVREKMEQANIIVFLFSPDFIASPECKKEWEHAKTLASRGRMIFRIPIILRECAWKDILNDDDIKALPTDGTPVTRFDDEDIAWNQVYEGIKEVVSQLRTTFTPRQEFLEEIDKTDFISQSHLRLQELFVFLRMTYDDLRGSEQTLRDTTISSRTDLLNNKRVLIHGEEKSGKTALARHLYLSLLEEGKPALFVDLAHASGKLDEGFLRGIYQAQFHGEYSLWSQQEDRTLIVDNLIAAPRLLDFLVLAKDVFDRIIVTLASDVFYAFFKDETRLAEFRQMKIEPLNTESTRKAHQKTTRNRRWRTGCHRWVCRSGGRPSQFSNHFR